LEFSPLSSRGQSCAYIVANLLLFVASSSRLVAQTTSATFGTVISFGGTPSDIVLDESRGKLYLVNSNANRVDVYDYLNSQKLGPIAVGQRPLAAAMSMDNSYLYVTNNTSSTVSVIDLNRSSLIQTVTLPAKPEGVEVGADGRALISTAGNGTNNLNNTLLIFDRTQPLAQQIVAVQFPPPPATPTGLTPVQARPTTTFRGKLLRTPDGNFIVGVSVVNNSTQTVAYVYETLSGTLLRSRFVTGQSTALSVSPDGSRFMAGFTLYDTATLAVIGQENSANAPFPLAAINNTTNVGGSVFSPDGTTIYGAFNVAPVVTPAARPQASTLLLSDSRNLAIRLGLKLPESIVARMVTTSDGSKAWGLSESGILFLPLSTLFDQPILMPETTTVFLAQDQCNPGIAKMSLKINNVGNGKLTYSVPDTGTALESQAVSGMAPSNIVFTMDPGRSAVARQSGTNLYTGNAGTAVSVNLRSVDAINIPNTVKVFMNYRPSDERGVVYPVPTTGTVAEGLQDIVLDEQRSRVYISNSGYNRIEVFDTKKQRFITPMDAGQLPHQMTIGADGFLYVANTGGESISQIDLDAQKIVGEIKFPPIPRAGANPPSHVVALAAGLSGVQFLMATSNATGAIASQWEVIGGQALLRQPDSVAVNPNNTAQNTLPGPVQMLATADQKNIITMNGTGTVYLYDALSDQYTASRQLFNAPLQGYYGVLGAAPGGAYYIANGAVLSSSITQNLVDPGLRNVFAVAPIDQNSFVRITTPQRTANGAATRDDPRTLLETFDLQSGGAALVGAMAENPYIEVFGTSRVNVPPRQMVVDSAGNVYALTLSGLTVIPLTPANQNTKPQIGTGARAIVNSNDGTANIKPGGFVTVNGTNLAANSTADQTPVPTVMGGSCVLFDDVAAPLLQTSSGQISAQLPATIHSGVNVVQVRSLATGQSSDPVTITVQKP
jgi:YVTN family beta-propeller protein